MEVLIDQKTFGKKALHLPHGEGKKKKVPVGPPSSFFTAIVYLAFEFQKGVHLCCRTLYGGRGAPPFCV